MQCKHSASSTQNGWLIGISVIKTTIQNEFKDDARFTCRAKASETGKGKSFKIVFMFLILTFLCFFWLLLMKMSTNVASGNGLVIVTRVYREQDVSNRDAQPNEVVPPLPTLSGNCRRSAVPPQSGAVVQFIHLLEPVMKREQTTVGVSLISRSPSPPVFCSKFIHTTWQLHNSYCNAMGQTWLSK